MEKRGKIVEIINCEEGIAMALETLVTITQAERDYAYESSLIKGELDWRSGMEYAKLSGLEEGRAEASLKIAGKMKRMGDSVEKIQAITGLPTETIELLPAESK
jgi:predicted transposase/invertase (TIGR01784 family)